jgi:hypothetical protein
MTTPSNRRELFRTANTRDKLTLFQILLDARMLNKDMSLALLKVIHRELGTDTNDPSLYKNYAVSIAALRYYTSDLLQHVVASWKNKTGVSGD